MISRPWKLAVVLLIVGAEMLPAAEIKKRSKPKITVSRETTYVVEPLRPDGYVDYIAALNARYSRGVTPENNAAVLLWQAYGPDDLPEKIREPFFKMLGTPMPPLEGEYWVDSSRVIWSGAPDDENARHEFLWKEMDKAMARPWKRQDLPVIAAWLDRNEKPLEKIAAAVQRPRYYAPVVAEGQWPLLYAAAVPNIGRPRDVVRALVCRALLRAGEGRTEEAWQDLLTGHRLARLAGQSPTLVDGLIGNAFHGMVGQGTLQLAHYGKLSRRQVETMVADLQRLPASLPMAERFDIAERFMYQDGIAHVAEGGTDLVSFLSDISSTSDDRVEHSFIHIAADVLVDWDVPSRMGNRWYDRLASIARLPPGTIRAMQTKMFDDDLKELAAKAKDPCSLAWFLVQSPRYSTGEKVGQFSVALLMTALSACLRADDRASMNAQLLPVALWLTVYRNENGQYPESLAQAVPKYLPAVPKDPFADGPIRYQRRGEGFILYSVGQNGEDDQGRDPGESTEDGTDRWPDDLAVKVPAPEETEQ